MLLCCCLLQQRIVDFIANAACAHQLAANHHLKIRLGKEARAAPRPKKLLSPIDSRNLRGIDIENQQN